ncbi:hypothetical protein RP29_07065 [Acidovorax temperans]|uniref:DUF2917 family protein n=1 Tax=Acidovorax temperans TaxID=80878 RepID=A0A0D7KB78_9BURK|nr:hypothetical protein RP29_07065 [Acidovorax temperans]
MQPCAQPSVHRRAAAGCWRLPPGRALSLKPRESGVLRIAQGRVWLTGAAPAQDLVLQAGDALAVAVGQHLVLEPWGWPGECDAPVLFQWSHVAPQPHRHRARTRAARDWELGVVQPLQELVRGLAGAGRAVGAAAAQVMAAAGRLGVGLAGFALGRVMATAAPSEKEICMKNGCSA